VEINGSGGTSGSAARSMTHSAAAVHPRRPLQNKSTCRTGISEGTQVEGIADFDGFVRMNLPALLRFGAALTGNAHDGADLVQAALEKAGVHWRRVAATDNPVGYVKAIMANTRVNWWRQRRRESLLAELPETGEVDTYPSDSTGVWSVVAALPKRQRAVMVLRYLDGHSEAEIAAILQIAPGTVKSQASKAAATLRKTLSDSYAKEA
jgi:RNA polymerase sigma-70 factor (sigma-E family)